MLIIMISMLIALWAAGAASAVHLWRQSKRDERAQRKILGLPVRPGV